MNEKGLPLSLKKLVIMFRNPENSVHDMNEPITMIFDYGLSIVESKYNMKCNALL